MLGEARSLLLKELLQKLRFYFFVVEHIQNRRNILLRVARPEKYAFEVAVKITMDLVD